MSRKAAFQVFAIGHSTLPVERFIELLKAQGITQLADIRTIPKSRYNPQYNTEKLAKSLASKDIEYRHMADLGGLRKAHKDSVNMGWHNSSFRGYADYMQTAEFREALIDLIAWAKAGPTAIMCAEAVPWRCHRSLVADALTIRGIKVMDIMHDGRVQPHRLTKFAHVEGEQITYPAEPDLLTTLA